MFKFEKLQFNHGRIYKILDYIFQEYDLNFRKEFSYEEFEDKEALTEVVKELQAYRKTINLKTKKKTQNTLVLSPLELRYLKSIYVEQNRYESSSRINVLSIGLSLIALIVSVLTYVLSENNRIVGIILLIFVGWIINWLINSSMDS